MGSDWSVSLWANCCRLPSETSMPTGRKAPGDICAMLKSESGVASVPLKLHWLFTSPWWFKISGDWRLSWGFGGILSVSDGLWLAEAADWFGFRNLAHSWPVTISSSKLNEPRPMSKSLVDLAQENRICQPKLQMKEENKQWIYPTLSWCHRYSCHTLSKVLH